VYVWLLAVKAVVVLLGLVVAFQGFRAARRERSQRMLLTAGGFTFLSVGSVLGGVCYDAFQLSRPLSGTIQSGVVGVGMVLIFLSVFLPGSAPQ